MATIKRTIAGKGPQPSPTKEQRAAIRRLLRGRGSVNIRALALGESTPVVITFGVNIRNVSEESLEDLLKSVRTACKDN